MVDKQMILELLIFALAGTIVVSGVLYLEDLCEKERAIQMATP